MYGTYTGHVNKANAVDSHDWTTYSRHVGYRYNRRELSDDGKQAGRRSSVE
jgi:hypothetical protein